MTSAERTENILSLMAQNWDEVRQQSSFLWEGWRVLIADAIRKAIAEEREACAKIVDDADGGRVLPANGIAHFIRSRP